MDDDDGGGGADDGDGDGDDDDPAWPGGMRGAIEYSRPGGMRGAIEYRSAVRKMWKHQMHQSKLKLKLKTKCHQPVRELPTSDSPWQSCLDSNTTLGANGEHGPLGRAMDNHYRLPVPPHPQNKLTWW